MKTIAMTCTYEVKTRYATMPPDYNTAVLAAGALPLTLPLTDSPNAWDAMLDAADALIFCGGADVDPAVYGEDKLSCCHETIPERDRQELYLLKRALQTGKPFLAICRGMQIMNCACGGTLYQDIASQMNDQIFHPDHKHRAEYVHTVNIVKGTLMYDIVKSEQIQVNTRHHQGVKSLGQGLTVCGIAPDGLIEVIQAQSPTMALGVQWHPESLALAHPEHMALFKRLIASIPA